MQNGTKYNREQVTDVLAATDIVGLIGTYVELKSAGRAFKGLCPFHHEKTPSFTVNRERQIYHCFGCGKGGDALSFLMEFEGLSFGEALRKLADRAGIRLARVQDGDPARDQLREQTAALMAFADSFFRAQLRDPERGGPGREYLDSRALKPETVERFGLGYVPAGFSNLIDAARRAGHRDKAIEACGLFRRGERGGWYDFFRHRLMFPIRDLTGRAVAFGGRALAADEVKYFNSPETLVYKKSRVLYGLYEGRDALRREKRAMLVEGYFDLLRLADAGFGNVVATCGTALTSEQAALLRRYVGEVVLVYDGDSAGIQAALRGIGILMAVGLHVRAIALPGGQDPDDFVRASGAAAFEERLNNAPDFVTFFIEMSAARCTSIEGRATVARELFGIFQSIEDELRLEEYLKRAGRELGLNEWSFRREFEKFRRGVVKPAPVRTNPEDRPAAPFQKDDLEFLSLLLLREPLREQAARELENVDLGSGPLAQVLQYVFANEGAREDWRDRLEDPEAQRLFTAASAYEPPQSAAADSLFAKRLVSLEQDALRTRAGILQEQIREAERKQDFDRVGLLLAEKVAVERRIREKIGAA